MALLTTLPSNVWGRSDQKCFQLPHTLTQSFKELHIVPGTLGRKRGLFRAKPIPSYREGLRKSILIVNLDSEYLIFIYFPFGGDSCCTWHTIQIVQ